MIDTIMAERGSQLTISDVTETSHTRKRHIDVGSYRVEHEKVTENGRVTYNKVCIGLHHNSSRGGHYSKLECFSPETAKAIASALFLVQQE